MVLPRAATRRTALGRCALGVALSGLVIAVSVLARPVGASAAPVSPTPSTSATTVGSGSNSTGPAGSGPVTLPPVPAVSQTITDGQSPQTLLNLALQMSAIGQQTAPLQDAVSASQRRLDADAVISRSADAAAAAATARAAAAASAAAAAQAGYEGLAGALHNAVLRMYVDGPTASPAVSPSDMVLAADYAATTLTPDGLLASRKHFAQQQHAAVAVARAEKSTAQAQAAKADAAVANERKVGQQLEAELSELGAINAAEVAADHKALAQQAGRQLTTATALEFIPAQAVPAPVATTNVALAWAFSELGKPYVWGATGPDTFDCSGLTQFVWAKAGVAIPRVAADQDAWAIPVPLSQILPGDLVFYGTTDIHHVGIYIGDGLMINAPHTGDVVRVSSIWWSDLAGFGRVHAVGVPVPAHTTPTPSKPVLPVVVPTATPVPSQSSPPPGWTPQPGQGSPMPGYVAPGASSTTTSTSTTSTPPSTNNPGGSSGGAPTSSTSTTAGTSTTTATGTPNAGPTLYFPSSTGPPPAG
jgi:cell wall-associated NlpC family hydrolase